LALTPAGPGRMRDRLLRSHLAENVEAKSQNLRRLVMPAFQAGLQCLVVMVYSPGLAG